MNSMLIYVADHPVHLELHNDGHNGPAFSVVAMRSRSTTVSFARFRHFKDADACCNKYSVYYPFVKFFVQPTLF